MTVENVTEGMPTALLAGDEASSRGPLRATLERAGYRVLEADGSAALVSCASQHSPDVIITSAFSGASDGLESVRLLRSNRATDKTAIIVLMGVGGRTNVRAAFDAGADDCLLRAVGPEELLTRVECVRQRRDGLRELQRSHDLLGEHARILTLLLDFSGTLAQTEDFDCLLTDTIAATASLTRCRRICILLPDPERKVLRIAESTGIDEQTAASLRVPVGEGVCGRVFSSGGQIVIDTATEMASGRDVYDSELFNDPPVLAMAMRASEHTLGVLYAAGQIGRSDFSDNDLDYLRLISNCAASVMQSILTRQAREKAREAIAVALASLAEHRDSDTGKHLDRMTGFCVVLAERLRGGSKYASEVDSEFIYNLRRAAPLHDVGKVAIPDHILLKPGPLTPAEMKTMRTHAEVGAETVRSARARSPDSPFLMMAEEIAYAHHEWVDGGGYPRGLSGAEIPLSARIAALADVYDALTSKRVYKDRIPHARARSIIVALTGRQFDPVIVDAFLSGESEFEKLAEELRDDCGPADTRLPAAPDSSETESACDESPLIEIVPRDHEQIVLSGRKPSG